MKIYSFDGKKSSIDNFDLNSSPLFLGRKFIVSEKSDTDEMKNEETPEKQIEK